jgi:hypothetical protein
MEGTYPPAERWQELTPQEQATRLLVSQDLREAIQFWRGDPRLNHWEEGFLTGMWQLIDRFHGKAKISPKQWDKLHAIFDKMMQADAAVQLSAEDA